MSDPAAAVTDLYERHAAAWDAARVASPFAERGWIDRFADLLPAGGRVLDVGCGAGRPIAAHLVGRGFDVTGIDSSPALVALARVRLPQARFQVADMRSFDLGERFDGVLAWHSLFHLTGSDQRAALARLVAHAAPRATLAFTSGPDEGVAIGCFEGEALHHASLAPAAYRAILADAGFAVVDHVVEDAGAGHATVWLARREG